jgi:hypothetical protein
MQKIIFLMKSSEQEAKYCFYKRKHTFVHRQALFLSKAGEIFQLKKTDKFASG